MTTTLRATSAPPGQQKYLARQPIFDRHENVLAYELLFRSGAHNYFDCPDADAAGHRLLDNSFLYGLEPLLEGRKAFINFTREAVLQDFAALLPKEILVVELLETVHADGLVVAACRKLKQRGYTIALDDFVPGGPAEPLTQFADIIKVDWLQSPPFEREALVRHYSPQGIKMLAEKVETHADFHRAVELGYTYFQGYFFSKPEMLQARDIPGFKLNYLRILKTVNQPALNLEEVEQVFREEPSLLFRLLRYLNSPVFGLRSTVSSVRHAITLLGEGNLRKWISMVAIGAMAEDKPAELILTSLIRARFCELLAPLMGFQKVAPDLFLMGLMSVIDAVLDRPMRIILDEIPIAPEIKEALAEGKGPLQGVLSLVLRFEHGDWDELAALATACAVCEEEIPELYRQSVVWAQQIFAA